MRIEIYHHQNDVVARRRYLGVEKDRVVVGVVKLQVVVELESAVFPPDLVQARDPFLELIFFRVEIFLAARQRLILAKLKAAVDAVQTRERGRERDSNHEGRAA